MWIRSQDKTTLVNTDNISAIEIYEDEIGTLYISATNDRSAFNLGHYATEQDAMGVMEGFELCFKYPDIKLCDMPPMAARKLWEEDNEEDTK